MAETKLTLTQVADSSRKGIFFAIGLLVLILSIRTGFPLIKNLVVRVNPPPPPPPKPIFGKLPTLKIETVNILGGPSYNLETGNGRLPTFPDKVYVLEATKPQYTQLSGWRMKQTANHLGFSGDPVQQLGAEHIWSDAERQTTMSANIITGHFFINQNTTVINDKYPLGSAPDTVSAATATQSFLNNITPPPPQEYKEGTKKTSWEYITDGSFAQADFGHQAQLIRVDVFGKVSINDTTYPILGPNPKEGLITTWVGQTEGSSHVVEAKYQVWPIEKTENPASYTIRPIEDAWLDVQQGRAAIVYLKEGKNNPKRKTTTADIKRVDIYKVYIAYYLTPEYQQYIQPVFVFEGVGITVERGRQVDFVAYVGAVAKEWYKSEEEK